MGPSRTRLEADEFIDLSTEAFRQALQEALAGTAPDRDPEVAGRRAAVAVNAGPAWVEVAGPFTDSAGAAAALGGVTKQAVSQRVASLSLLGLRLAPGGTGRDRIVYPTWQFHPTVLAHLGTVLGAAGVEPDRPATGWTVAAWLASPNDDLDALRPVDLLRAGRIEPVLRAARDVAESLGRSERAARSDRAGRRSRAA